MTQKNVTLFIGAARPGGRRDDQVSTRTSSSASENGSAAHEFTREAIIAFARAYDPQPFHLDDAAGEASIFGSLCASGWHTAGVAMREIVDWRDAHRAERRARGEPLPAARRLAGRAKHALAASRCGPATYVTFRSRVESMRETKRPQWGLVGIPRHRRRSGRARSSVILQSRLRRAPRPLTRPRDRKAGSLARCD